MKGYGLSTFRDNIVSRFDVTVIGIVTKVNNGRDLIMVRIENGPVASRQANLVQGMSGSPIYINGKLIGAISQGEGFQKEPVNMVTPIEDMLEAWDPHIPQRPLYFQPKELDAPRASRNGKQTGFHWKPDDRERAITLPKPIVVKRRRITRLVLNARADDPRRSTSDTAILRRATTYLTVSSLNEKDRAWLQKEFDRLGYPVTVAKGLGGGKGAKAASNTTTLRPGGVFGAFLATGDVTVGATGTVTYRKGNRFLGFGHPFFNLGPLETAITTASIVDIVSGFQVSHHVAVSGNVVGTLTQDRDYSVSADIGRMPRMIPFHVTVRDATNRRSQTFKTEVFQHPDLTPILLRLIAQQAVARIHNVPGDVMIRTTTTIDANEIGTVSRTSLTQTSDEARLSVTQDLTDIANIVSANPFYPLPIRSAKMTVDIEPGRRTAVVERIFLKQGRYEPGETVEIGVVLKPYRQPAVTRTLSLNLPANIPAGRHTLFVRGGAPTVTRIGPFVVSSGNNEPQSPPANVRQMVQRLKEQPATTELLARLQLTTASPVIEGERLSALPPHLNALMRSDRNSALRLERDEIRSILPTEYVVSGTQQLLLNVVRKNLLEQSGQSGQSGGPGGSTSSGPMARLSNPERTEVSAGEEELSVSEQEKELLETQETKQELQLRPDIRRWQAALEVSQDKGKNKALPEKKQKQEPKKDAPPEAQPKPEAVKTPEQPAEQTQPAQPVPPPPPDYSNERPVGRQMQTWRQVARTDFTNGKFSGTSIASTGELRLTPTLHRLATTTETYLWSLVSDAEGNLYAGTGTSGTILRIDPKGNVRTLARLPVLAVQCLLMGKDGALYAGGSAPGHLFKVTLSGSVTPLGSISEKVLTALAQDTVGNIYMASGTGGTLYRLAAGQTRPAPFAQLAGDYVTSLATDSQNNLYAGVGGLGILYKITPDGTIGILYDAPEDTITAVAVDTKNQVYFGTGPKGTLYRLNADGTATVLLDRAASFITGLRAASSEILYATSVGAVYRIQPQPGGLPTIVQPFESPKDLDFLTLTLLPGGHVATGTGNIGEVYVAVPNALRSGTFESVVRDARLESQWGVARWNAVLVGGGRVKMETRSGNTAEPDARWSAWQSVQSIPGMMNEGRVQSPAARFLQYRLTLERGEGGDPPALRDLTLSYLPRNQMPRVTFQAPMGGERWSKSQTVRWNATDPDNDMLTYQVYYSADNGESWKPLPAAKVEVKPGASSATPPAVTSSSPGTGEPLSMEELQKRLDSEPNMPEALKKAILEGARRRIAAMNLLTMGIPSTGVTPGSSRDTQRTVDTTLLPDGAYLIKVVASDQASNPTEAQTAQAISEPFVICNAAPEIRLKTQPIVGPDKSIALEGVVSQKLVAITALQYRVDGGDWMAISAKDGLFDAMQEEFVLVTAPLAPGKHTLEILTFNAAGNRAAEKVTVEVK
jgi:sugar lactone lactonase YvrE